MFRQVYKIKFSTKYLCYNYIILKMKEKEEIKDPGVPIVASQQNQEEEQEYLSEEEEQTIDQSILLQWKIVDLPIITTVNGEQNELKIAQFKVQLYRWKESDKQWVERGVGNLKFLKHKLTNLTRIVMRADKTYLFRANHRLIKEGPYCQLEKSKTNQRSWIWRANDFTEGTYKMEVFSAKLKTEEDSENFKAQFEKSCDENLAYIEQSKKEETDD